MPSGRRFQTRYILRKLGSVLVITLFRHIMTLKLQSHRDSFVKSLGLIFESFAFRHEMGHIDFTVTTL